MLCLDASTRLPDWGGVGPEHLGDPLTNKGTAFTAEERLRLQIEGPPTRRHMREREHFRACSEHSADPATHEAHS